MKTGLFAVVAATLLTLTGCPYRYAILIQNRTGHKIAVGWSYMYLQHAKWVQSGGERTIMPPAKGYDDELFVMDYSEKSGHFYKAPEELFRKVQAEHLLGFQRSGSDIVYIVAIYQDYIVVSGQGLELTVHSSGTGREVCSVIFTLPLFCRIQRDQQDG